MELNIQRKMAEMIVNFILNHLSEAEDEANEM